MGVSQVVGAAKRRVRTLGGTLIRRLHLLPGGTPDGLGDDDALLGTSIDSQLVVYFADTPDSMYQIEEWYRTFEALDREFGLTVICMDSRTARIIRSQTTLTVLVIARDSTVDDILSRSDVRVCLYVNHNPLNFLNMQIRSLVHVSMLHGDSDKGVSVSNQVKAYDYALVAGQAAVDRLEKYTMLFDAERRCIPVGYPETTSHSLPEGMTPANGKRVLYAPTWEGGHPTLSYSSVRSHGEIIVRQLLAAGYEVIYRPHPLTGVRVAEYREADSAIKSLVGESEGSRVSEGIPLSADFAAADILISDVSAVANNWLRSGRPLIVTVPASEQTTVARTRLLDVVPRLTASAAASIASVVARELDEDPTRDQRNELIEYYFGDTAPGAALERMKDAIRRLMDIREREWARVTENES